MADGPGQVMYAQIQWRRDVGEFQETGLEPRGRVCRADGIERDDAWIRDGQTIPLIVSLFGGFGFPGQPFWGNQAVTP